MTGFLAHLSPGGQVGIDLEAGGTCEGCGGTFKDGDDWVAIAEMKDNRTQRTFEIHPRCFTKLKAKLETDGEHSV